MWVCVHVYNYVLSTCIMCACAVCMYSCVYYMCAGMKVYACMCVCLGVRQTFFAFSFYFPRLHAVFCLPLWCVILCFSLAQTSPWWNSQKLAKGSLQFLLLKEHQHERKKMNTHLGKQLMTSLEIKNLRWKLKDAAILTWSPLMLHISLVSLRHFFWTPSWHKFEW